ncbi:PAS domain-containing hybrid sensor histidine kinase/response regulator [Kaarinaea lacus]
MIDDLFLYLSNNSPAVTYMCKPGGNFCTSFITDNIKTQLGYSPEAFLKHSDFWINNIHPDDRQRVLNGLQTLYTNGWHIHEYRFKAASGEYRWMRDELRLIPSQDNHPEYIIGYWTDITDRKLAEEKLQQAYTDLEAQLAERTDELREVLAKLTTAQIALQNSDQKYRSLFEVSHDALLLLDEKRFIDCNPVSLQLFACPSRENFLKLSPADLSPPKQPNGMDSRELSAHYIQKAFRDGGLRFEWLVQRCDDTQFDCEVQLSRMELNEKPLLLAVCRDITERKQAELERESLHRQLHQVYRMDAIGRLAGGIAHDFNNLLASILGFSNLAKRLTERPDALDKIKDYLDEVILAGERGKQLVQQLIAFTRGGKPQLTIFNPMQRIEETVQMMRSTIPSSMDLVVQPLDNDIYIKTDLVQLQQVLVNMIINARDAIESEKGRITITTKNAVGVNTVCDSCSQPISGNYIEISVSDTGHGIRTDEISRIFEPFYSTKQNGKGSGLGLSVAHGIMHSCGGHIAIKSTPNVGTTFQLYFPIVNGKDTSVPATTNDSTSSVPSFGKNASILVIDDEISITSLLKSLLETNHYSVDTYIDSNYALEQIMQEMDKYDLIITDQTMHGLTGIELAEKVREINKDIPIILCTGFSATVDKELAAKKGVNAYLYKPINNDLLLRTVHKLINNGELSKG